jgi:hypothetical protein
VVTATARETVVSTIKTDHAAAMTLAENRAAVTSTPDPVVVTKTVTMSLPSNKHETNVYKPVQFYADKEEEEEEEDYDDDHHTEDVWADDIASSVETGMPHPDIDGISFHSDVDIYGDLEDVQDRSSSDSWERHLDDVDEDYKLRPPRKKTSGSVISVQSVGNYFLSKSFPVSDFDEVLNSQRTTESGVRIAVFIKKKLIMKRSKC